MSAPTYLFIRDASHNVSTYLPTFLTIMDSNNKKARR